MIQIYYGCEAYKMDLLKEVALKDVDEFNHQNFAGMSEDILTFLNEQSLIAGKKVAVVNLLDLSELEHSVYKSITEEYAETEDIAVLFCAKSADKRRKFVKEIIKNAKECGRCASEPELAKIIRFEAKVKGYVFEPAAEKMFIERTGYLIDDSLNLYHIKNMVLDLTELSENGIITEETVMTNIPENILFNAFTLTALIEQGKIGEVKKQVAKIKDGNTISAISAMLYDFRTTYKIKLGMNSKEVGVFKESPFLKYSEAQLLDCINICCKTIEKIKCGEIPEKDALMYACLEITKIIK